MGLSYHYPKPLVLDTVLFPGLPPPLPRLRVQTERLRKDRNSVVLALPHYLPALPQPARGGSSGLVVCRLRAGRTWVVAVYPRS